MAIILRRYRSVTHPWVDPLDGHHLHAALLQAVGEHGTKDGWRGCQHHLMCHKVHCLQVVVFYSERDITELPLKPQLIHDDEGCGCVTLERVAEHAVAIAGWWRHLSLALRHPWSRVHAQLRPRPGAFILARQCETRAEQPRIRF